MASVRSCQKLCLTVSSVPRQTQPGPMSGSGSRASMMVYLRRVKSHCRAAAGEGSENMRRKQLCRHKVSAEGGAGGAPDARAEIPLQPVVQTMAKHLCPCSP